MYTPQRNLILIRHSHPKIVPDWQATQWTLSDVGRLRCHQLAKRITPHYPDLVVTSTEIKAMETGQIIAADLGKPVKTSEGLHEHARPNVGWYDTVEQFEEQVAHFFQNPSQLVFGAETADAAYRRFNNTLNGIMEAHPGWNVAVVTHGTVMSLYIARLAGIDAFSFWRGLGLPAYVVVSLPDGQIIERVMSIGE